MTVYILLNDHLFALALVMMPNTAFAAAARQMAAQVSEFCKSNPAAPPMMPKQPSQRQEPAGPENSQVSSEDGMARCSTACAEPTSPAGPATPETFARQNSRWSIGVGWTQGFRPSMEDAHAVDLELDGETGVLAVFDGHGGDECALHCAEQVGPAILNTRGWRSGDLRSALNEAFLILDSQVCSACPSSSGTTGTVVLMQKGKLVAAGVGDSKAVLLRGGRIFPMTVDHRPTEPAEEARIRCAGGFVHRGRVNACLNVSRALGDAQFKQDAFRPACEQQVSPEPDIREANIATSTDFLLLCSDGVWNSMKETTVLRFVRQRLLNGMPLANICQELCQACMEPCRTAYDNITAILCTFRGAALDGCTSLSLDGRPERPTQHDSTTGGRGSLDSISAAQRRPQQSPHTPEKARTQTPPAHSRSGNLA